MGLDRAGGVVRDTVARAWCRPNDSRDCGNFVYNLTGCGLQPRVGFLGIQ